MLHAADLIRVAARRIATVHPDLGRHLTNALRTGFVCGYHPRGLQYLEPLLRQPGRSFHVAELIRFAASPGHRSAAEDESAEAIERARKAVTNRIRQTVLRIADVHRDLGLHLRNAVHTGTHCTYTPERRTRWSG